MSDYVLHHTECDRCVFGEKGFYNVICAHCTYCSYSKVETKFMTREIAELLGVVKKKEVEE